MLLGDREFCSKDLATWLLDIGWGYCLRIKKSTYVHLNKEESVTLNQLASHPGISIFLQGVNITKTADKFPFNVAAHYPKEHHGLPITEGWFLLTTLPDIHSAISAYATRFQIEEMFRDYKSYGFNLELTQLNGSTPFPLKEYRKRYNYERSEEKMNEFEPKIEISRPR